VQDLPGPGGRFTERFTEGGELTRITAFTDALMAVAITLLVLNGRVPQRGDRPGDAAGDAVLRSGRRPPAES
jgi:uncharacterized membrane protein